MLQLDPFQQATPIPRTNAELVALTPAERDAFRRHLLRALEGKNRRGWQSVAGQLGTTVASLHAFMARFETR